MLNRERERIWQAAGLVALTLALTGTPAQAGDDFLVPVSDSTAGFGPFDGSDAAAAVDAFGSPSSQRRTLGGQVCEMRWPDLGIKAFFVDFGGENDPCEAGIFTRARLTSRRWHTPTGLRVGDPQSRAKRDSKRKCKANRTCAVDGYALGLFRSDCAVTKVPTVVAQTRRGRVVALWAHWRSCE